MKQFLLAILLILAAGLARVEAQVVSPPPPKEYQVQIRYRLHAGVQERVRQYFPMVQFFQSLGFKRTDDGDDDLEAGDTSRNRMEGTIGSANARRLLEQSHVRSILLMPAGYKLPGLEEEDKPVKIQIELIGGLPQGQQRLLADQVRERLKEFG